VVPQRKEGQAKGYQIFVRPRGAAPFEWPHNILLYFGFWIENILYVNFFTFKNASSKFPQNCQLLGSDIHKKRFVSKEEDTCADTRGRMKGQHRCVKWMESVCQSRGY